MKFLKCTIVLIVLLALAMFIYQDAQHGWDYTLSSYSQALNNTKSGIEYLQQQL